MSDVFAGEGRMSKLVTRRPATDLEREVIAALQHVSLPPATGKKRFIKSFTVPVQQVSDREANYALFLAYHFRRQLAPRLVSRVWEEWYRNPSRLDGLTMITGELLRFYSTVRTAE